MKRVIKWWMGEVYCGFGVNVASWAKIDVTFLKYPRRDARPELRFYIRKKTTVRPEGTFRVCKVVLWPFAILALSHRLDRT